MVITCTKTLLIQSINCQPTKLTNNALPEIMRVILMLLFFLSNETIFFFFVFPHLFILRIFSMLPK